MAPLILQSVVKQVAEKLKQKDVAIDNAIIRKTEEQYRVLSTKVTAGKLQFDTPERRAAVLLWENTEDLSWDQVCACIGVQQVKKLQQFHQLVKNYLAPQQSIQRRSVRNRNQVIQYKSNTTSTVYEPKLLPELVIRLSGFLFDPNGTQRQAISLLEALYRDVPKNASERRGHLYDLQRYQAAYEAAALYHVAQRNGCRVEPILAAKKRKKNPTDELMDDNDSEEEASQTQATTSTHPLQLSDIMELSSAYTYLEVKEKLPKIQELASKQEQRKAPPPKRSRADKATSRLKPSTKDEATSNVAERIVNLADTMETDTDNRRDQDDAASFLSHKQQILEEACERYRTSGEQTREELLLQAADAVLLKYELVKSSR